VEFLDDALDPSTRARLAAHLRECRSCRRLVEEHRSAWKALDLLDEVEVSADLHGRVLEIPALERRSRMVRLRGPLAVLAAAAVIVIAVFFGWRHGLFGGGEPVSPAPAGVPDEAIIAQLDLIENLEFLQEHAVELDAHRELALLELFEPYREVEGEDGGENR
jgi:anti-sigma factor RsiW